MQVAVTVGGPYKRAWLTQRCSACDWSENAHGTELEKCPNCGAEIDSNRVLESGITRIEYRCRKNQFAIRDLSTNQEVVFYESDLPDTLRFLVRHFRDWSGEIQETSKPRAKARNRG